MSWDNAPGFHRIWPQFFIQLGLSPSLATVLATDGRRAACHVPDDRVRADDRLLEPGGVSVVAAEEIPGQIPPVLAADLLAEIHRGPDKLRLRIAITVGARVVGEAVMAALEALEDATEVGGFDLGSVTVEAGPAALSSDLTGLPDAIGVAWPLGHRAVLRGPPRPRVAAVRASLRYWVPLTKITRAYSGHHV